MGQALSLFVDLRPEKPLAAVVSGLHAPFILEEIVPIEGMAGLKDLCHRLNPKARFTRANIAIYPDSRFLRHATLENPSKAREDNFFEQFLKTQYQMELKEQSVMILNPSTGVAVDFDKVVPKEILITGAAQKDIVASQTDILAQGAFPERLELGTLATLGGLMHYQRAQQMGSSAVHLEWGAKQSLFTICSAKRVELCRAIPFGTETLLEEIKNDLHLKDLTSVQKALSAGSFDFNEMGPEILKPFIKELQASAGFFEVQTGQPLKNFVLTQLPAAFGWVEGILTQYLGLTALSIDYRGWFNTLGFKVREEKVKVAELTRDHLGLVSLMIQGEGK